MLMIVAHHYVTNSGLTGSDGPLLKDFLSANSLFLTLFGAWGKTGINCFLMITGYYMCTSRITLRKFLKLMGQIYLYKLLFYSIFIFSGYETLSITRLTMVAMPMWGVSGDFVGCFIIFWLTIPFFNILVQNMTQRLHGLLLLLILTVYTLLGSIPTFDVTFNYVTWFGVIYFIASYIRLYPLPIFEKKALWGWITLLCTILGSISVLGLRILIGAPAGLGYNFLADSNKIFAVVIAVSSFLWFKNMNIKYSKVINALGAGTFGVLLIHANSSAMRTWLWKDTIDVEGHYSMPFGDLVLFSIGVVFVVFIICNLIDQIRILSFEKWFFYWYDHKIAIKAERFVKKLYR